MPSYPCQCPCGETKFQLHAKPFLRFFCHCEICQRLYNKPFSDVTAIRTKDLSLPDTGIHFKTYRLPPALQRGTCAHCGLPVAGILTTVPGLKLAFVTGDNYLDRSILPEPLGHVFYHRRTADIEDNLPKVEGYWSSELKICQWLAPALWHSRSPIIA